ncbi:DUF3316 domain-containing protein [Agarivorans gilvus]|uniref:DUF3316 domain-containing protein n=1 Tax=Agarivorans gilvus TaxID=680279 RepID=A0ABQ1I5M1_9ALTE|nr:DUF3316 domain-containing protein [Agarivorans gilvus]GGB18785.1 hypothetical protein GCM10007414_35250 [Agarivorans gilvus]
MKNLTILAAGLLATASVFASPLTVSSSTTVNAGTFESKTAAYDAGFNLANSLQEMERSQLSQQLSLWAHTPPSNIEVTNPEVKVVEVANSPEDIQYRAVVNVDYRFKTIESN